MCEVTGRDDVQSPYYPLSTFHFTPTMASICASGMNTVSTQRPLANARAPMRSVALRGAAVPARRVRSVAVRASADDKFADYKAKQAFLFPGQGAQKVGMAKEAVEACPAAKALFDKATEILGYDLLQVCAEGPAEKLNSTV
eukprot:6767970-Pyramimonas_sp.AAC.1